MKLPALLLFIVAPVACASPQGPDESTGAPGESPRCAEQALAKAPELLRFHYGQPTDVHVDSNARALPKIANPANPEQELDVVEVDGSIYRANYRMRFTYFVSGGECALIGQEILEHAVP